MKHLGTILGVIAGMLYERISLRRSAGIGGGWLQA